MRFSTVSNDRKKQLLETNKQCLSNVNLQSAEISNVDLSGAHLEGANLKLCRVPESILLAHVSKETEAVFSVLETEDGRVVEANLCVFENENRILLSSNSSIVNNSTVSECNRFVSLEEFSDEFSSEAPKN